MAMIFKTCTRRVNRSGRLMFILAALTLVNACQPVTPPIEAGLLSGRVMRAGNAKAPGVGSNLQASLNTALRVPGELVVRYRDTRTAARGLSASGLQALGLREAGGGGAVRVLALVPEAGSGANLGAETESQRLESAMARLRADQDVLAVGPNYLYGRLATPNDPFFAQQKNLELIGMPAAWDVQKGANGIRVAVLDDGYDPAVGDMNGRLQLTPPSGGYWLDTANKDNTPTALPGDWHGTAVASVLGAATDNGIGMAGVTWQGIQIVPVKIYRDTPFPPCTTPARAPIEPRDPAPPPPPPCQNVFDATTATVAAALDTAVAVGASVVNLSFCLLDRVNTTACATATDAVLEAAMARTYQSGLVLVGAAGNDNLGDVSYPASSRWVLAVGSIGTRADPLALTRSEFSNYGPKVDLVAPGQAIPTLRGGDVLTSSGTSFSSPTVAGVAALLRSNGFFNPDQIVARIVETTQDIGVPGRDDQTGNGLVRADRALAGPDISTGIPMTITVRDVSGVGVRQIRTTLQPGKSLGSFEVPNLSGGQYRLRFHLDVNRNGLEDFGDEVGDLVVNVDRARLYGQDVRLIVI